MKRFLILLIFFVSITFMFSQSPTHYIVGKEVFDGVSLYSIIQDKDNSILISSNQGIYRYNGVSFNRIKSDNTKNNALFGLTKDKKGDVYCFNFSGEIFKVKNNKLEFFYSIKPALVGGSVSIQFDNLNNLVIATNHNIYKISQEKQNLELFKRRGYFFAERNDTLFYGKDFKNNKTGIVGLYNNKEIPILEFHSDKHLLLSHSSLFPLKSDFLGFEKTNNDFFSLKSKTLEKVQLNIPTNSSTGVYYSNNKLWFTDIKNGVYCLREDDLTAKPDKWFEDYFISGIFTDKEGNTWLLTFDDGVIIIPNLNVINYAKKNEKFVGLNKIKNKIYVSTKKGEVLSFENKKFNPFFKQPNDRFEYFGIFDEDLIISNKNIYKNRKKVGKDISFNRKAVKLGDSIFLALHSGMFRVSVNNFSDQKRITTTRTNTIHLDTLTNKIWISSVAGLSVYKNGKEYPVKYKGKPITSIKIINIENQIWVLSNNGIYIVENEKVVKHITEKDGLLSNGNEEIKYVSPYVYLSSYKGIQQYNLKTKKSREFTRPNGLTKRITHFEVLNDTVYALTNQGLLTFTFNKPNVNNSIKYKTQIQEAIINGTTPLKNNAILAPEENNIDFSFLTTTYKFKKELHYTYQLIGYDNKPKDVRTGNYHVNYSKLPSGKYTFVVKSNINEKENIPATINFKIREHWYKSIWTKIILIFTLLLILYFVYISRVKMLTRKRREVELNKRLAESSLISLKAQMNPHFMFNAMNSVQSLILKDDKENAYSYLTKLSKLIRKSLEASGTTWIYLDEEILQLTNYLDLEKLRFSSNLNYEINASNELCSLKIPSMILQPFVENAIKHGLLHKNENEEKWLEVNFEQKGDVLLCTIKDNGIGRKASKEINDKKSNGHKSFSTKAIENRFKLLNEYLNIKVGFSYSDLVNNKKEVIGTCVTLKIPYMLDDNE